MTLLPAERLALNVAKAQLARGENPPSNTTAMLVMAIERLTGLEESPECYQVADGRYCADDPRRYQP
jgi:hypothetical protein